jgi:O-antigen/teichoic acid export membrane protein
MNKFSKVRDVNGEYVVGKIGLLRHYLVTKATENITAGDKKFLQALDKRQPPVPFRRFYQKMRETFRHNLSANGIQLFVNQAFSLLTFYLLSKGLSKNSFGELNWTLAVFLLGFSIASFGFDQLVIKKTASHEDAKHLLSIHLFHVMLSGLLLYGGLLICVIVFPAFFISPQLFLFIGLGKLLLFFSTPFKAIATGRERFRIVLWMSVSSASLKALVLLFLAVRGILTLSTVVPVFVLSDASEMAVGFYLTRQVLHLSITPRIRLREYIRFAKEGLPQIGTVIFTSALSRIDWILIGLFLSASRLAEYSFAYKAFEFATLPLLTIAPLLVPYFSRLQKAGLPLLYQPRVQLLLRTEMMIACFVALCLNLLWNPMVDLITDGKYGASNTHTILIFSLSLPVLYLNNFLWSLHFASGHLRLIFYSFVLCFALNLTGNLLLIPLFGNEGAAVAFFLSTFVQTLYYAAKLKTKLPAGLISLVACSVCALLSGSLSLLFSANVFVILLVGCTLYMVFLFCTLQLRKKDWRLLWQTVTD